MKGVLSILAAGAALLAHGKGSAETLHDDFGAVCAIPQADMKATLAAADAAGWQTVPTAGAAAPKLPNGVVLKSYAVRTRSISGVPTILVSGDGISPATSTAPATDVKMCMMLSTKPDLASLSAEKADLNGEPFVVSSPASIYLVDRSSGRASPLRGPQAKAGFVNGTLAMVMLIDTPTATGLSYQVPHPNP